jgi:hypothetical protein
MRQRREAGERQRLADAKQAELTRLREYLRQWERKIEVVVDAVRDEKYVEEKKHGVMHRAASVVFTADGIDFVAVLHLTEATIDTPLVERRKLPSEYFRVGLPGQQYTRNIQSVEDLGLELRGQ